MQHLMNPNLTCWLLQKNFASCLIVKTIYFSRCLLRQRSRTAAGALNGICLQRTHSVTNVPPLSTVKMPLATVNGPVTFAKPLHIDCRKRLCVGTEQPPPLKLPLLAAGGVIEPAVRSRKFTKMLLVLPEGAAVKVSVVPSGTAYADAAS